MPSRRVREPRWSAFASLTRSGKLGIRDLSLVRNPREEERPCAPDHVAARVKRAVWERDGGRCQWPLESGGVCGSTLRLELDHIHPRALSGPSTVGNMRVLCKVHNDLAARKVFGEAWMDRFTRQAGKGGELELPFA